jgi:hypothetical protein
MREFCCFSFLFLYSYFHSHFILSDLQSPLLVKIIARKHKIIAALRAAGAYEEMPEDNEGLDLAG